MRNYCITTNTNYASEASAALFATSLRFIWPYAFRDVFNHHAFTGRYSFSQAFDESFNSLSSWQWGPDSPLEPILPLPPELRLEDTNDQHTMALASVHANLGDKISGLSWEKETGSMADDDPFSCWPTMPQGESAQFNSSGPAIDTVVGPPDSELLFDHNNWDTLDLEWGVV